MVNKERRKYLEEKKQLMVLATRYLELYGEKLYWDVTVCARTQDPEIRKEKPARKRSKNQELGHEFIEDYINGRALTTLTQEYHVSFNRGRQHLIDNGIEIRRARKKQ